MLKIQLLSAETLTPRTARFARELEKFQERAIGFDGV